MLAAAPFDSNIDAASSTCISSSQGYQISYAVHFRLQSLMAEQYLPLRRSCPLSIHVLTVQGGCSCGAVGYEIDMASEVEWPMEPWLCPSDIVRLSMIVIDPYNDCRHSTDSSLSIWLCAPTSLVESSLVVYSESSLHYLVSKSLSGTGPLQITSYIHLKAQMSYTMAEISNAYI